MRIDYYCLALNLALVFYESIGIDFFWIQTEITLATFRRSQRYYDIIYLYRSYTGTYFSYNSCTFMP